MNGSVSYEKEIAIFSLALANAMNSGSLSFYLSLYGILCSAVCLKKIKLDFLGDTITGKDIVGS